MSQVVRKMRACAESRSTFKAMKSCIPLRKSKVHSYRTVHISSANEDHETAAEMYNDENAGPQLSRAELEQTSTADMERLSIVQLSQSEELMRRAANDLEHLQPRALQEIGSLRTRDRARPPDALVRLLTALLYLLREQTTWDSALDVLDQRETTTRLAKLSPSSFSAPDMAVVRKLVTVRGDFLQHIEFLKCPAALVLAKWLVLFLGMPVEAGKLQSRLQDMEEDESRLLPGTAHILQQKACTALSQVPATLDEAAQRMRRLGPAAFQEIGSTRMKRRVVAAGGKWPPQALVRVLGAVSVLMREPTTWASAMQLMARKDIVQALLSIDRESLSGDVLAMVRKLVDSNGDIQRHVDTMCSESLSALTTWLVCFTVMHERRASTLELTDAEF